MNYDSGLLCRFSSRRPLRSVLKGAQHGKQTCSNVAALIVRGHQTHPASLAAIVERAQPREDPNQIIGVAPDRTFQGTV